MCLSENKLKSDFLSLFLPLHFLSYNLYVKSTEKGS